MRVLRDALAVRDARDAPTPVSPTQELDELQARIAKMEAQMATIEADIRAQVAAEHAAAIKAEREEADRRVAAKEAEIEEFKELYAKEALARKKIHNKLLDIQCVPVPALPAASRRAMLTCGSGAALWQGEHPRVCSVAACPRRGAEEGP